MGTVTNDIIKIISSKLSILKKCLFFLQGDDFSSEDVFGTSDEEETEPEVELQMDLPASSSDEFRLEETGGSDDVLSTHKDDELVMHLIKGMKRK